MDVPGETKKEIHAHETRRLSSPVFAAKTGSPRNPKLSADKDLHELGVLSSSSSYSTISDDDDLQYPIVYAESDRDYIEDVDDDSDLPNAESKDEWSDNDITFEDTMKHRSYFENAKKRRQRHLKNRSRGTIPSLHFTGTKRTDFWRKYGIEPNKVIEHGSIKSVETILSEDELKKVEPTERRIHINGQKFKVVHNMEPTDSLYRAICQALGMLEETYELVKQNIFAELKEKWHLFSQEVWLYGEKSNLDLKPSLTSQKLMLKRYKDFLNQSQNSIPEFELRAAALHYGFTYAIAEIQGENQPVNVINCQDETVLSGGTAKYYFMKTGGTSACYEFLLPIGPLKKIHDGQYPLLLRDVIVVEQIRPWGLNSEAISKESYKPPIGPIPKGFGVDHRVFLHRSTVSHDLWSLLAELMFRKLIHAPQIKSRIIDSKHNFALYYFACKAKKRYQFYGKASIEKLADDFSQRFSKENPRGDLEDLAQAAAYFEFSYTLIGLDAGGNFYWRDYLSQNAIMGENAPYLAFFVKTLRDKTMFWYALEDVGRSCPKEKKLYRNVMAGDLTAWGGRFYFYYRPVPKASFLEEPSSKKLFRVPTQVIFRARMWATKSYAVISSSIKASVSSAAKKTHSFVQSFLNFFRWVASRRKVVPDKKVEELYVRENP